MSQSKSNASLARSGAHHARGMVIYYTLAMLFAVCAFCSLAVDLGRVQVVKSELRRASDSAARAAVAMLPDYTAGNSVAVHYAKLNLADGKPVELDPATDIEFGTWNVSTRQFTVLTGSARANANAVRVTSRRTAARNNATPLMFGKLIGANSCDATASAVAALKIKPAMDVVGINGITMNGNDRIDSYDSRSGPYSTATSSDKVNVASNNSITMIGTGSLRGNVYYGGSVPSGAISGIIAMLDEPLNYAPPELPSSYTSHGSVSLTGGQSLSLDSGNHYFTSLSMSGSTVLNVSGKVKIFVRDTFTMSGNSEITVAGNIPANLEINIMGTSPVNLGQNDLFAVLYAPQSALIMNGNADLFGAVVASSIQMNGNNTIHYDESMSKPPPPPGILLVK